MVNTSSIPQIIIKYTPQPRAVSARPNLLQRAQARAAPPLMLLAQPRRRQRWRQRRRGGREPDWVRPASASASASVRARRPARRRPRPTARQRPQPTNGVRADAVTIDSVCVVPPFPLLPSLAQGRCIRGLERPLHGAHASCVKCPKAPNRISQLTFCGLSFIGALAVPGAGVRGWLAFSFGR